MTDQTSHSPIDTQTVPGETCVRCHTTKDWGSSSWCPDCGYYPSLDSEGISDDSWKQQVPAEPKEDADAGLFESLPAWFWVMMGGMTTILLIGLVIRTQAAEAESVRGIIALATLAIALPVAAVAHFLASRDAMKRDPRINVMDALVSWVTVWQPSIGRLPETRRRMWSMSWSLTAAVTALVIIGGIDYAAPFRVDEQAKKKSSANKVIQSVTAAAKAAGQKGSANMEEALGQLTDTEMMAGGPASMEDAVSGLAAVPDKLTDMAGADEDGLAGSDDEEETAEQKILCIVYGVLTNDEKTPTGFLFAGRPRSQYQHVAEIDAEDMSREDYQRVAARLARRIQKRPAIPTQLDAVWVDPVLVCRLRYVRMNNDGTIVGAEFDEIIRDGRNHSAASSPRSKSGRH